MDELKNRNPQAIQPVHANADGRRCCGRPLSEKCSPEEEAAKINPVTGEKSCCNGHHHHHHK